MSGSQKGAVLIEIPPPETPPSESQDLPMADVRSSSPKNFSEFIRHVDLKSFKNTNDFLNDPACKKRWEETKQWFQKQHFKF